MTNTEEKSVDAPQSDVSVEKKDIIKGGLVPMEKLLKDAKAGLKIYKEGDAVTVTVEKPMKNKVIVSIDDRLRGIIAGKELSFDPQFAKGLNIGDVITAYVVLPEDDEGRVLLSLRKAGKDNIWSDLVQKHNSKETIAVVVTEANKGGLMIDMGGVKGFLPVSQLSAEHYPRVDGGDKNEILGKLQQMVGKSVDVKILSIEKNSNKLIFSEREAIGNRDIPTEIKVGDIVEGKVTGMVDFGFFVDVGGIEGLVHISEISWAKVDDIANFVKVGDILKLKIIDIENSRLSLSMKRLEEDPWKKLVEDLKLGDLVEGAVSRFTPFGAFVKIKTSGGELDALVHISEISHRHITDPKEVLAMGDKKQFKVVSIEPDQHRLSLSLKALEEAPKDKEDKKPKKEIEERVIEGLDSLGSAILKKLEKVGIKTLEDLKGKTKEEIMDIEGIGDKTAEKIIELANK